MKENMAAALVLLSHWYPEDPFMDPVCGSGTLPIEAALLGRNIAPGINRHFVCEQWQQVDETMVSKLREEARAAEKHDV